MENGICCVKEMFCHVGVPTPSSGGRVGDIDQNNYARPTSRAGHRLGLTHLQISNFCTMIKQQIVRHDVEVLYLLVYFYF
jgi:hypothetical protein